jgi:hypothetical protein
MKGAVIRSDNGQMPLSFEQFAMRANVIAVFDHSGRAGNTFFTCIFDQHSQVLVCPWVHYFYSYATTAFGEEQEIDSRAAHEFATKTWYFRLVYDEPNDAGTVLIEKFGGDPNASIDRSALREMFDEIVLSQPSITRRNLLLACYFAFAVGIGRDIYKIKFVLIDDAITLRSETPLTGYSGRVVDLIKSDFDSAVMLHLIRDPRAGFASTNHQFVNALGNEYGIHWGNYAHSLRRLLAGDLGWDGVFVFGFCLLFFHQSFLTIERKKAQYADQFSVVKNEDLNLRFSEAMKAICDSLGITFLEAWNDARYVPTMLGIPWRSMGGYNNRYQAPRFGPLENDSDEVSRGTAGPNKFVTERWRNRLSRSEIFLIEWFLRSELRRYGYVFLQAGEDQESVPRMMLRLVLPLRGELPTLRWIVRGARLGAGEVLDRIFFAISFLPFYVGVRLVILRMLRSPVLSQR